MAAPRRLSRYVHRAQGLLRRRRGAHLPDAHLAHRAIEIVPGVTSVARASTTCASSRVTPPASRPRRRRSTSRPVRAAPRPPRPPRRRLPRNFSQVDRRAMGRSRLGGRPDTGRRAEELAAAELERQGFRILARNWRRPEGELDRLPTTTAPASCRGPFAYRPRTGGSPGIDHGCASVRRSSVRRGSSSTASRSRQPRLPLRRRGGDLLRRHARAGLPQAHPQRVRSRRRADARQSVTGWPAARLNPARDGSGHEVACRRT